MSESPAAADRAATSPGALCVTLAGCEGASGDDSAARGALDPANVGAAMRVRVAAVEHGRVERRGVAGADPAPSHAASRPAG